MHGKNNLAWQVKQSAELYGVERWGNDYFGVSPEGNVTAKTLTKEVALLDIIHGMIERDLQMPVLLRIENILDAQIMRLNEAFAAQGLACLRALGVADDAPHVNPNGGAIAIGHPLGMSGARLVLTAAYELRRRGGRYALCTMCVGVGQGVAMIIEAA